MSDFLKRENNNSISINSTTDNYNLSSTTSSSNILATIIPILILCAISTVIGFVSL
jgi:hypothetical protein